MHIGKHAGLNYLHAFTQEQTLRLNAYYYRDSGTQQDSTLNLYAAQGDTVGVFENNDIHDKKELMKGSLRYELNSRRLYLTEEASAMFNLGDARNNCGSNLGVLQERVRRRLYDVQNVAEATVNTGALLFDVSSIVRFYASRERFGIIPAYGDAATDNTVRLRNLFTHRIGTNFGLFGGNLGLGYILEHKHWQTCAG